MTIPRSVNLTQAFFCVDGQNGRFFKVATVAIVTHVILLSWLTAIRDDVLNLKVATAIFLDLR